MRRAIAMRRSPRPQRDVRARIRLIGTNNTSRSHFTRCSMITRIGCGRSAQSLFLGPTGNAPDRTVSQNCCYEAGTITVGGSDGVAAGCSEVGCSKACCGVGTGAVEVD
jgi:hypothetical protein